MQSIPTSSLTMRSTEAHITSICLNKDGDLLFTSGRDGLVSIWDVASGQRLGNYVYVADHAFDREQSILESMERPNAAVSRVDVNEASTEVVASVFNTLCIWDVRSGQLLDNITFDGSLSSVEWNRNPLHQDMLLVACTTRGCRDRTAKPHLKIMKCLDLNPDCKGSSSRPWKCLHSFDGIDDQTSICAWGPLDQTVIVGSDDGTIHVWDINGNRVAALKAHNTRVTAISFNEDRSVFMSVSGDATAKLWSAADWTLIKTYNLDRPLNTCAISPLMDCNEETKYFHALVAGGQDAGEVTTSEDSAGKFEAVILDLISGNELGRVSAHFSPVTAIAFSRDGRSMISGAYEGNCKIVKLPPAFFSSELVSSTAVTDEMI